ncbi:MAG: hypothetical protein NT154_05720 [Verrucomicrobia bacterium]|nr:hypothetical protein [Verrucomicrobiota bacterium]
MSKEHITFDISFWENGTGAMFGVGTEHRALMDASSVPQAGDVVIHHDHEGARRFRVSHREFDFQSGVCYLHVHLDLSSPSAT